MKVKMLVNTNWNGKREAGKIYGDVPSDVANRWRSRGIAEVEAEEESEEVERNNPYIGKKPSELYKLCKARGLEAEPKKDAEYYMGILLNADIEAAVDVSSSKEEEVKE